MGNIFKGSCTQYIHDHSIQFLHSAAGKCRPNIFKFNAAVTSFFLLTQVLLSDTNLISETLSGVKESLFIENLPAETVPIESPVLLQSGFSVQL